MHWRALTVASVRGCVCTWDGKLGTEFGTVGGERRVVIGVKPAPGLQQQDRCVAKVKINHMAAGAWSKRLENMV